MYQGKHQLDFSRNVAKKYENIIVVEKIENIQDVIVGYNDIIKKMKIGIKSNNNIFNEKFEELVQGLFE